MGTFNQECKEIKNQFVMDHIVGIHPPSGLIRYFVESNHTSGIGVCRITESSILSNEFISIPMLEIGWAFNNPKGSHSLSRNKLFYIAYMRSLVYSQCWIHQDKIQVPKLAKINSDGSMDLCIQNSRFYDHATGSYVFSHSESAVRKEKKFHFSKNRAIYFLNFLLKVSTWLRKFHAEKGVECPAWMNVIVSDIHQGDCNILPSKSSKFEFTHSNEFGYVTQIKDIII